VTLSWMGAAALAACWPLMGSAGGAFSVRWLRLPPIFLAPLVFAAGSIAAYVVLWAYFLDPRAGRAAWTLLVLLNATWLVPRLSSAWRRGGVERDAWMPFALTVLVTTACLGYLAWAGVSPPRRFAIALPVADHLVPRLFADRLAQGLRNEPRPLAPLTTFALTTQTSDRPPLQAGVVLAARPSWSTSAATRDFGYQIVATSCQVSILPALLALCAALDLSGRERRFVLVAVTCSGFFLVNAVYPWPKLYAAALLVTGLAILVHVTRRGEGRDRHAIAIGSLTGLALLAHGGPVFSLLAAPVLLAHASVRRLLRPRRIALAILAAATLLAPWLAYQRYIDPPGTRLVKIHLAGIRDADDRPLLQAILEAYRHRNGEEWWRDRVQNVRMQGFVGWHGDDVATDAQNAVFFRHLPALDLLAIGLVALAFQRPRGSGLTPKALALYAVLAWAVWTLVMFSGDSAAIQHGSYTTLLLLFMGGGIGLAAWPRVGSGLLTLHVALFAAAWLLPRAGIPVVRWDPAAAILTTAAALAAVLLARTWLQDSPPAQSANTA
jgi:hypothetical protein